MPVRRFPPYKTHFALRVERGAISNSLSVSYRMDYEVRSRVAREMRSEWRHVYMYIERDKTEEGREKESKEEEEKERGDRVKGTTK